MTIAVGGGMFGWRPSFIFLSVFTLSFFILSFSFVLFHSPFYISVCLSISLRVSLCFCYFVSACLFACLLSHTPVAVCLFLCLDLFFYLALLCCRCPVVPVRPCLISTLPAWRRISRSRMKESRRRTSWAPLSIPRYWRLLLYDAFLISCVLTCFNMRIGCHI